MKCLAVNVSRFTIYANIIYSQMNALSLGRATLAVLIADAC